MRDTPKKPADTLRSARWLNRDDLRSFGHRSRLLQMGLDQEDWQDKPIIGILNTWSQMNPCHMHFRDRADDVRKGVLQAGGLPVEIPTISVDETFTKPTSMLYRNLLAMEVEETIRSHPLDGVVLMGGCDKSTPGLVMGALTAGIPMIFLPAGPMLRGHHAGKVLGSGSDAWKFWDDRRAGKVSEKEWAGVEGGIARSYGHCMTMGTASTMTAIVDAMGLCLPGASSIPAADSGHKRMSTQTGRMITEMVWSDTTPAAVLDDSSIRNAIIVAMAMGCSTNAVVHVLAMAHRAGIALSLDDFDRLGREIPVIANVRPSGKGYLMEDFYYAGGLPGLMSRLTSKLDLEAKTVTGQSLGDTLQEARVYNDDVIRTVDTAVYPEGSIAVVRGNLAPDGAVIKPAACDPKFYKHTGPALVFDSYPEMKAAVEDDDLDVTPDHVMILRNAGPLGGPGFPEWGMLPIPNKLVKQGHRDMLRISDARMSGTSYGACILHVAPESFVGGPLALVQTGDMIHFDMENRQLDLMISAEEMARRKAEWQPPAPNFQRGYGWMFAQHVNQANEGCDFDFLSRDFGAAAGEPDIY
ncbi:L-arabinonate dehydratase [Marinovum sp. 2_MG-2023]|uniref:L-arabinonate dehydratase n=1 Tax=unclassified Marinovum TaxID=2647166 RepID=UPI0026E24881|nr:MULTISPECIES: L-arabinonate dehydratase [unclassified Marinovum]MDO6730979.1 L-arabinonate dehydratase [Marinovum sp. 2_MG-2023]MDO6780206.1 L-arabinonate dehydratase [Marinovum sp. 1_MG-2023]